jgi:meso-butanediol dehydrogenase/(S,S)-butanediol dehydrogenase/diacetyl reductase
MSGRLDGKVAIITGTGDGQGRAVARRFAAEGARVVGCDLREDAAAETVQLVRESGGEMISIHPTDLSDEDAAKALVAAAVDAYGGIDVLYNNAMGSRRGDALTSSVDDFMFTMRNAVLLAWLTTKHAAPVIASGGGGSIINVASIGGMDVGTGMVGNFDQTFPYAVAKGGVVRMTTYLAVSLAPLGIRVNTLSPGAIETPLTAPLFGVPGDARHEAHLDMMLIKRFGTGEDIANGAVFLASDESSYVTGTNLVIDGGWRVSGGRGWPDPPVFDRSPA